MLLSVMRVSWRTLTTACLLVAGTGPVVAAQSPAPPPAARAQFDTGNAALKRHDAPRAVLAFRRAVTIDPSYYDAHDSLVSATKRVYEKADTNFDFDDSLWMRRRMHEDSLATAALTREYKGWAATNPKIAAYQWALGTLKGESPEAEPYYLKAVALDPKLARAYEWLSLIAEFRGDNAASAEYLHKAAQADPKNAKYASSYAAKFLDSDFNKFRTLSLDVAKRFPGTDNGASALSWLAYNTTSDTAAAAIYEDLRRQYPLAQSERARNYMWRLFDVDMRIAPDKALALAEELLRLSSDADDERTWAVKVVFARNIVLARSLLGDKKYAAASAVLDGTQLPKYSTDDEMFALLRAAAADSASRTKVAYDTLLVRFAKTPSDAMHAALARYATKLGKNPTQVDSEVWVLRDKAAKPAPSFKLGLYTSKDSVSLADYKGKVVLLTFWFPGCGPCRGEFPHFQKIVQEFQGRPLAYVGVNVDPDQNPYVLPFLKGTGYTFTPLRGDDKFAEHVYHVRGEPTNFLIDGQGRIVFTDFMIHDAAAEQMLHLMIASMLDHGGTS